ncbi:MAG TPA: ABC transporter ATP-binding protein [Xanthobacteraceae bacterium]|nr:ABC transporter ATP-binding protein [Xanthobacteraceae bacterium]
MALLETHDLTAFYGHFQALYGISLTVREGETVAIIGANGAGKTTFLKTIAGLIKARPSAVQFAGEEIGSRPASDIVRRGIALVPEGRRLFASLSVEENLLVGGDSSRHSGYWALKTVYRLFPALAERRDAPATALSGGQQQMVAIGRGLMSNPKLLLCDEISLGLAPIIIRDIYAVLPHVKAQGTSLLIVEQDIVRAVSVADRVYCFQEGRVMLSGRPQDLTKDAIHAAYFGL